LHKLHYTLLFYTPQLNCKLPTGYTNMYVKKGL
jgi:hypothetical protein